MIFSKLTRLFIEETFSQTPKEAKRHVVCQFVVRCVYPLPSHCGAMKSAFNAIQEALLIVRLMRASFKIEVHKRAEV